MRRKQFPPFLRFSSFRVQIFKKKKKKKNTEAFTENSKNAHV